uniref:F-box domain-containing protein n=1 Tax=Strongyloides papillosus TaxID=174720 RepID=A0A0N5BVA7_STREA
MDAEEISFMNIMEVGLVRKKIFEYLPSFKNIRHLASTCWKLNQIIKNEKITKNLFYDCGEITIRFTMIDAIRDFTDVQEESKFEDYAFIKTDHLYSNVIIKNENFDRDRFISGNTVGISFSNAVGRLSSEKYIPFIMKLAQQYNINYEERKDLTCLQLSDETFSQGCSVLLKVLPYLHHENINTIKIPMTFFPTNSYKYDGLLNGIFDRFPKLYRLGIDLSGGSIFVSDLSLNKDAIYDIMGQLSRKKNATIHFYYKNDDHYYYINNFSVFFESAMKHGINVTMDESTLLRMEERGISDILKHHNYSIEQHVTTCKTCIYSLDIISRDRLRKIRYYENLEKFCLILNLNLNDCSLEENFKALGNIKSLNNLKKVIAIKLTFVKPHDGISEDEIEIFHRNVKFLIQLLPKSVKRLRLYGVPKLTYDITRTIKRHIPNIEVLSLCNVSIEETDCLSVFKKLQVLVIRGDITVKIPDSVKLFAINTMESTKKDINQKLFNEYSKKFSKSLTHNKGRTIFFNDINDWRCYKQMLQMERFF